MKKTILSFASFCAVLLLVGAGCATGGTTDSTPSEPATDTTTEAAATDDVAPTSDAAITITKAEPTGNRTLLVEFDVDEEKTKDAEGYRLFLSNDEEPTWPTKGYWYQLGTAHKIKEWKALPLGERYLRACIVVADDCAEYSEVLKVEVE